MIKDLLNCQLVNKIFYNEIKYIKRDKRITRRSIYLKKYYFNIWKTYRNSKSRSGKNVNSWIKKFKSPDRPILLF